MRCHPVLLLRLARKAKNLIHRIPTDENSRKDVTQRRFLDWKCQKLSRKARNPSLPFYIRPSRSRNNRTAKQLRRKTPRCHHLWLPHVHHIMASPVSWRPICRMKICHHCPLLLCVQANLNRGLSYAMTGQNNGQPNAYAFSEMELLTFPKGWAPNWKLCGKVNT